MRTQHLRLNTDRALPMKSVISIDWGSWSLGFRSCLFLWISLYTCVGWGELMPQLDWFSKGDLMSMKAAKSIRKTGGQ